MLEKCFLLKKKMKVTKELQFYEIKAMKRQSNEIKDVRYKIKTVFEF